MARPRLILRDYQPGDIDRFPPRADFAAEKAAVAWAWRDGPPPGRTWTLWEMGRQIPLRTLGVGGVFGLEGGVWQAWALLAELTPRQWYCAGQLAQQVLDGVQLFNGRTITATARTSIRGAVFMLEKLGFQRAYVGRDARMGGVLYQHMIRAA